MGFRDLADKWKRKQKCIGCGNAILDSERAGKRTSIWWDYCTPCLKQRMDTELAFLEAQARKAKAEAARREAEERAYPQVLLPPADVDLPNFADMMMKEIKKDLLLQAMLSSGKANVTFKLHDKPSPTDTSGVGYAKTSMDWASASKHNQPETQTPPFRPKRRTAESFGELIDQLADMGYNDGSPKEKELPVCAVDVCDDPATITMVKGERKELVCADCAETFFTPFGFTPNPLTDTDGK